MPVILKGNLIKEIISKNDNTTIVNLEIDNQSSKKINGILIKIKQVINLLLYIIKKFFLSVYFLWTQNRQKYSL